MAINAIVQAGETAVWAHSLGGEDVTFLVEQAEMHGLLVNGGSDFHWKNKNDLCIGKLNTDENEIDEKELTVLEKV